MTGLEENTGYLYTLGDGKGNWSELYPYTVKNPRSYEFICLAVYGQDKTPQFSHVTLEARI